MKNQRLVLALLVLISTLTFTYQAVWADDEAPPVTRWMNPHKIARPLHEPSREAQTLNISPWIPDRLRPPDTPGANLGRICLVVDSNVLTDIADGLAQYEADLMRMGFDTIIHEYTSGTPEALRAHLALLYEQSASLVGAVFIGNIPHIVYELMEDFGTGDKYEDFPCDIFYMDLDGTWSDTLADGSVTPDNGKYDTRGGNLELEIWVSRMKTDNLPAMGTESVLLNAYFDKNHRYRRKTLLPGDEALVYNDDDWASMATEDAAQLGMVYNASTITTVSGPELTTASDYRDDQLTAPYEFIFIRSHGWGGGHGFYRDSRTIFEYVNAYDYHQIDPAAVFYSLFVCSGADFTVDDNLSGTIAFNPDDSGLLTFGSTKTGGMWNAHTFYSELADGSVFGEAFRLWFNVSFRQACMK